MSETGQVLKAARGLIAGGAWCKGQSYDGDGKHCVLGAVLEAQRQLYPLDRHDRDAMELLNRLAPVDEEQAEGMGLPRAAAFNDLSATTLNDVVTLFDKALAELGEL